MTDQGVKTSAYYISFRWPAGKREITYSFAEQEIGGSRGSAFDTVQFSNEDKETIRDAMTAWEQVCGVTFKEVQDHPDNDLRIGWADLSQGGNELGLAGYLISGKDIKTWITFNTAIGWKEQPWYGIDNELIYDVALHEIGHIMGINHSDVPYSTLGGSPWYYYNGGPGRNQLQGDAWIIAEHEISNDITAALALFGPPDSKVEKLLVGTSQPDTIKGNFGNDYIKGEGGDDVLMGNGEYWTHYDNPQDSYWSRTFDGTTDRDTIDGGNGDDFINGNAGADFLFGGPGNDTIFGG